jgi:hypothetical protein
MRTLAYRCGRRCLVLCVLLLAGTPRTSHAWAIGSQLNEKGCHELITAEALRAVRARFDTAPVVAPTRDEAAMIDDVLFSPPGDFVHDLAGMTLLLGVRDNDLKGIDPLSSLDLIQVHGNPSTQDEHCIRSASDDDAPGNPAALSACRAFIHAAAAEALDGLSADGSVDATHRIPLELYLAIRGHIEPALPLFYVKIGAAVHALEDGFPHTYRTDDGMKVTVVLNWIDLVGDTYDETRDGPAHRAELDRCWDDTDPTIARNYAIATEAATALLTVALDPSLSRDQKLAQIDAVTAKYLGYEPGCTADNDWCSPPEATVTNSLTGCNAAGTESLLCGLLVTIALIIAVRRRRPCALDGRSLVPRLAMARQHCSARIRGRSAEAQRRRRHCAMTVGAVWLALAAVALPARADDPPPPATPTPGTPAANTTPAVPTSPTVPSTEPGKEPGRDVPTPTVTEVAKVRADKELGSQWGFAASAGGSIDRTAVAGSLGVRYHIREQWVVGLDAGWNPWVTTSPMTVHAGVATLSGVLIRRFPMKFDRVNLRSSLHLGASTLLFDVYGAPKYSTGPYGAITPLGIDYDLGGHVRIVWDAIEVALPVPLVGQLPLYYEQFRMMIGVQVGG